LLVGNRFVGNRECRQTKLLAKCCRQTRLLAIGNVGKRSCWQNVVGKRSCWQNVVGKRSCGNWDCNDPTFGRAIESMRRWCASLMSGFGSSSSDAKINKETRLEFITERIVMIYCKLSWTYLQEKRVTSWWHRRFIARCGAMHASVTYVRRNV